MIFCSAKCGCKDAVAQGVAMKRILVANRGEIGLRAVRAARKLGIATVAAFSDADRNSPHVWAADHSVCIGPPAAALSYLNGPALVEAARGSGCDAIYPGYGFLSEKSAFAAACREEGLIFIGPSPEAISLMGDKVEARRVAERNGVPVVPGSQQGFTDADQAARVANEIGFPMLQNSLRNFHRHRRKHWLPLAMRRFTWNTSLHVCVTLKFKYSATVMAMRFIYGNAIAVSSAATKSWLRKHRRLFSMRPFVCRWLRPRRRSFAISSMKALAPSNSSTILTAADG